MFITQKKLDKLLENHVAADELPAAFARIAVETVALLAPLALDNVLRKFVWEGEREHGRLSTICRILLEADGKGVKTDE